MFSANQSETASKLVGGVPFAFLSVRLQIQSPCTPIHYSTLKVRGVRAQTCKPNRQTKDSL